VFAATGRPPFGEGSGVDMLYRIVHTEPDLTALRELAPDLAETVAACLDKNPDGRPTADRLVRLASQQAARSGAEEPGGADWPAPVMVTLLARAAFAEQPAPAPAVPLPAESPTRALRVTGPDAKPERAWYRRLVPLVVPVLLVAGTTTAVELLPYGSPPKGAQGSPQLPDPTGPVDSASSTGPTGPSTPGSPTPSGTTPDTGTSSTPPAATTPAPDPNGSPDANANANQGGAGNSGGGGGSSTGGSSTGGGTEKSGSTPATTPKPNPTPTPTPTPVKTYGPRCVFAGQATCGSDDPTVEMTYTGGWTDCTFTFTTTWGDGTTTYTDVSGTGSADVRKTYATHHYARPGTYTINLRAVTDSGFCLATGGTFTFTLTG